MIAPTAEGHNTPKQPRNLDHGEAEPKNAGRANSSGNDSIDDAPQWAALTHRSYLS